MRRFLVELAPTSTRGTCFFSCVAPSVERATELALRHHPGRAVIGVTVGDPPTARPAPWQPTSPDAGSGAP
jgi:hypothetical protein